MADKALVVIDIQNDITKHCQNALQALVATIKRAAETIDAEGDSHAKKYEQRIRH